VANTREYLGILASMTKQMDFPPEMPDLPAKALVLYLVVGYLGWLSLGLLFQKDIFLFGIPLISKTFSHWVHSCGLLLTLSICLFLLSCNRVDRSFFRGTYTVHAGWLAGFAAVFLVIGLIGTKVWIDKYPSIDDWGSQGFATRAEYKDFLLQTGENHGKRGRRIGTEELKRRGLGWGWTGWTVIPLMAYCLLIFGAFMDGPVRVLARLLARVRAGS